jgi:hypothetical protein
MHPEIEKLIDLALVDGKITDKEKSVILKNASELGIDQDEIEMYIDAKLHLYNKETTGTQIKCPSCGNKLSGLSKTCVCGYVLNSGTLKESKTLEASIETLENLIVQVRGLSSSAPKESIELLIAKIDKEIRYIKTRYSENNEIKILIAELEELSNKYVKKIVKKTKSRKHLIIISIGIGISIFLWLFISSRNIVRNIVSHKNQTTNDYLIKVDSISNIKLKSDLKSKKYYYENWDGFKEKFFEDYPDFGNGYVEYYHDKYKFSESISYKIAENQFNYIQKTFKSPLDFILYDDRNNYRSLNNTTKEDSTFILTLISSNRWKLKKEIDSKIVLIQNTELYSEYLDMNGVDSLKQARIIFWNDDIKKYILNENNGTYPKTGWIKAIMQSYRADEQTAKQFCLERLKFYESKFKMPIDFFYYRDNAHYSNRRDKDDENNIKLLQQWQKRN